MADTTTCAHGVPLDAPYCAGCDQVCKDIDGGAR